MGQKDFDRMFERQQAEIERALAELRSKRAEMEARMAALRAEMAAAELEMERAISAGGDQLSAVRRFRDRFGSWPGIHWPKRGRRRGREGGEPLPVEPKPNPKPLVDGAEAPLE